MQGLINEQMNQKEVEPISRTTYRKNFIIGVLFVGVMVVILAIGGAILLKSNDQQKILQQPFIEGNAIISMPTSTPTPVPFYELTVPYLRGRTYQSKLNALEKVSENQSYTSYLTSYTSDGLIVNGLLTQPKRDPSVGSEMPDGGWPAIVFVHGYIPPSQYQTLSQSYSAYVDYLARNGFVVFKIDLRGHGNSEGDPGGGYFSSDYVIDTLNAYTALQASEFVNPKRIGLWGHSMSGNVVMRSAAAKPGIPAIVVWAGAVYTYTDLGKYGISDASYQPPQTISERVRKRQQLFAIYGQPQDGNPFWQQIAPASYLSDMIGSIQLHHAVNDDVVSIEYSRNLDQLLDATSVSHELFEYQSGGHNISGNSFSQAMQQTVSFYKANLVEK